MVVVVCVSKLNKTQVQNMSSRFIIPDAQVTMVEPKTSAKGTQYSRIHFTFQVAGRNGQTFPKQSNLACFDQVAANAIQPNGIYDITGSVGVNQQGYLQLEFKEAKPKGAPAQQGQAPQGGYQQPQGGYQAPQAQPNQAPQYGSMPQQPQQAPQGQAPQAPAPATNFDDDIPF